MVNSSSTETADLLFVGDGDRVYWNSLGVTNGLLNAAQLELGIDDTIKREIGSRILRPSRGVPSLQFSDWLRGFVQGTGVETRTVNAKVEDVFQRFVDGSRPEDIVYPDVASHITSLQDDGRVDVLLHTAGPDIQQEAKKAASKLDIAHVVSVSPSKAENHHRWAHRRNGLITPKLSRLSTRTVRPARFIVLADDKGIAFTGQGGERVGGFNVVRPEEYSEADIARSILEMRPVGGVMVMRGLEGVAAHLFAAIDHPNDSEMLKIFWNTKK